MNIHALHVEVKAPLQIAHIWSVRWDCSARSAWQPCRCPRCRTAALFPVPSRLRSSSLPPFVQLSWLVTAYCGSLGVHQAMLCLIGFYRCTWGLIGVYRGFSGLLWVYQDFFGVLPSKSPSSIGILPQIPPAKILQPLCIEYC